MNATMISIFFLGYVFGSVPFGVLVSRLFGLGDLTQIGSGNIGATNVLRTGNKAAAAITLLLDIGKGLVAVLVARALSDAPGELIAGFGAFIGHLFPVWLGFRGGKGVATFLGVTLGVSWIAGLIALGTWLLVAVVARISSLSALVTASTAPLWLWVTIGPGAALLGLVMAVLLTIRHIPNIRRLLAGDEPRIGQS